MRCLPYARRLPCHRRGPVAARRSFEVLAAQGLSFDLQANPHQLAPFAAFLSGRAVDAAVPNIIVNHLGSPRLGRGAAEDAVVLADWRKGMTALAAHPTVFVKLSMLDFVRKVRIARRGRWLDWRESEWRWASFPPLLQEWRTDEAAKAEVTALVLEVIALFGSERCMFASNFPVERSSGWEFTELYRAFASIARDVSPGDQEWLFAKSAAKAYGLAL